MLMILQFLFWALAFHAQNSLSFVQQPTRLPVPKHNFRVSASSPANNPVDELSDERKANLFSFLLRDLEVEGVPLLGCDADQSHVFLAALFTVMGELCEKDEEGKACLVLENMPVDSLRIFVDDFALLKSEKRIIDAVPELSRFNVTLVGKGVGPAIVIETSCRSESEKEDYNSFKSSFLAPDEIKWTASMKMFVARMELEDGAVSNPLAYRIVGSPSVCDTLSAFWTCICELLVQPEDQLSSIVLCLPSTPMDSKTHEQFSAISELVSRIFFLYRGQDIFELRYFHPFYDRDQIVPKDDSSYGHLPPTSWLRSILKKSGNDHEAESMTDAELKIQNFQRSSPLPAITMKRVRQADSAAKNDELDLGNGRSETLSGISDYASNVIRLAGQGEESLQASLDAEIKLTQ